MGRYCPGVRPAGGSTHPVDIRQGRGPFRFVLPDLHGRPVRIGRPLFRLPAPAVEADGRRSLGPWSFLTGVFDLPKVVRG